MDPNHPIPNFLAHGGLSGAVATGTPTVAQARAAVASYTWDQTRPYALTGTLGVQHVFAKDYTVEARYVYTKGVHLWNQVRSILFLRLPQLSPRRAQDFQELRSEWASSALDRRHRLTITPIYDFKPFQRSNWVLKNIVGNWNISGTYTFQSPEFATIQSGVDSNLNHDTAGDRAIINPAGAANVGSGVTGYNAPGQPVAAGDPTTVA